MSVTIHPRPVWPPNSEKPTPPRERTPRDGIEYVPSSIYPESRSHDDPPFPNDLVAFPDAMTDVHAHVLVNDLMRNDWSIDKLAREWHITYAYARVLVALPIVQRELEALRHLIALRADLVALVRGEQSFRALGRIADMDLLDPADRDYSTKAANQRASLIRSACTTLLRESNRRNPTRTAQTKAPRRASPSDPAPTPEPTPDPAPTPEPAPDPASPPEPASPLESKPQRDRAPQDQPSSDSSSPSAFSSASPSSPPLPMAHSPLPSSSPLPMAHSPLPSPPCSSASSAFSSPPPISSRARDHPAC